MGQACVVEPLDYGVAPAGSHLLGSAVGAFRVAVPDNAEIHVGFGEWSSCRLADPPESEAVTMA
jgi:hypothetical protein